eukprot:COSAG01_NODE_334_length_18708_cov_49.649686_3_plen_103_part_00
MCDAATQSTIMIELLMTTSLEARHTYTHARTHTILAVRTSELVADEVNISKIAIKLRMEIFVQEFSRQVSFCDTTSIQKVEATTLSCNKLGVVCGPRCQLRG